jgi:hypothetical protein
MKINKSVIQFRIGAIGSLLATSIAVLSQLVSVDTPDNFVINTVALLAVAIPLLTLDVYMLISELIREKSVKSTLRGLLRLVAILFFFAAMTNIFLHFSQLAGLLFLSVTILSVFLFVWFYRSSRNITTEDK